MATRIYKDKSQAHQVAEEYTRRTGFDAYAKHHDTKPGFGVRYLKDNVKWCWMAEGMAHQYFVWAISRA